MKTSFTSASILAVLLLSISAIASPNPTAKRELNQTCYSHCVNAGQSDCVRCCTFAGGSNTNTGCFGQDPDRK
ncbi:hypothetical protein OC846_003605 [Tilletia horrida]|uniref:Uncharacterized protein n=1 Tax=Tilletia horrida TaxID=155126 RepID=A0AAN6JR70_9BASI|nr:hypothetical protein OC846_003605 [Tilletia horrida]KAK0565742.1 hypothetical protein OC861_003612 [Tilletia horrida]